MASPAPDFDVVIYGGTSGGVASALQSSRLGLKVALISPLNHIGGVQVEGLGYTDIDNQAQFTNSLAVGGLALELHRRISSKYDRLERLENVVKTKTKDPTVWRFEASVAEAVILEWLKEHANIEIIYASLVEQDAVTRSGNQVSSLKLSNGRTVSGKVFIEASYEGDFIAAAGITTAYGRESSSTYGESLAGVRDKTTYQQINLPIDPYNVPGDPSSGCIYGVSDEPFGQPGDGDKHLAAYSFRLPITNNPNNRLPFYKPDGYDPMHYELHSRYAKAGGTFFYPRVVIPNMKTDLIGSECPLATDLLGMNDDWIQSTMAERKELVKHLANFTKGLLYFFSHDECLSAEFRAHWSTFGYCLDEFPDNNHFPRMMYIRDARRMVSDYIVTEAAASEDSAIPQVHDPVAVAYWPLDTHCARRVVRDGKVHNEGFIFKDGHRWRPFGVAYRALVPRLAEATNVITATCPSSSHVGYGAIRIEHQFYALGQACANAADIAIKASIPLQDVPYTELRARLLAQGAVLDADLVGKPEFS